MDAEQELTAQLKQKRLEREKKALERISQVLAEENCELVVTPVVTINDKPLSISVRAK